MQFECNLCTVVHSILDLEIMMIDQDVGGGGGGGQRGKLHRIVLKKGLGGEGLRRRGGKVGPFRFYRRRSRWCLAPVGVDRVEWPAGEEVL